MWPEDIQEKHTKLLSEKSPLRKAPVRKAHGGYHQGSSIVQMGAQGIIGSGPRFRLGYEYPTPSKCGLIEFALLICFSENNSMKSLFNPNNCHQSGQRSTSSHTMIRIYLVTLRAKAVQFTFHRRWNKHTRIFTSSNRFDLCTGVHYNPYQHMASSNMQTVARPNTWLRVVLGMWVHVRTQGTSWAQDPQLAEDSFCDYHDECCE